MANTPPSNSKYPNVTEVSQEGYGSAISFLREHTFLKGIVNWVRPRFEQIDRNLRIEEVNRHGLSHQLPVACNVVNVMEAFGEDFFTHRQKVLAGIAAVIHDVGYAGGSMEDIEENGYNSGNKGKYKKHALKGANEVKKKLTQYLKLINGDYGNRTDRFGITPEKVEVIRKMLTYKDENGEAQLINSDDIELMWEAIAHHNDYGKDSEGYNPWILKNPDTLVLQLCDKLDNDRKRVYKEHLNSEDFIPDHERIDGSKRNSKYYHRSVPKCIRKYKFLINKQKERMTWVADVDLNEFNNIYPDFYNVETFTEDFLAAYGGNAEIAAEALGVIFHKRDEKESLKDQTQYLDAHHSLIVELRFSDGNVKRIRFNRPKREIYNSRSLAPWQEELEALKNAYDTTEGMRLEDKQGDIKEKVA